MALHEEVPASASAVFSRPLALKKRQKFSWLLHIYLITDTLALLLGSALSLYLTKIININYLGRESAIGYDTLWTEGFPLMAAVALLWFLHKGHYRVRMNFWLELRGVVSALGLAMLMEGFFQYAAKKDPSRLLLVSGWVFAAIGIVAFRGLVRAGLNYKGMWKVPTLLVGAGNTAADTARALKAEAGLGFEIAAQVQNLPEAFMLAGRSWEKLCAAHGADYVVIALDGNELEACEQPMAQLMRESVPFSISPPRRHLPVLDMVPQYFFNSDVTLLTHSSGLEQPLPQVVKRVFDIVVSSVALLGLSPVLLTIGALVKRDGGPVLFGHERIGKNGKTLRCLKFRSMVMNGDEVLRRHLEQHPEARAEWEATHKLKHDPRITRVGSFLRLTSLDELPQLINVLRGEMSLVGPRPIVSEEVRRYHHDIAHYYRVNPGITGLWQVSGRSDVTYDQRVQMDSWYVRNWSLWHDIAIICKTFPALLRRNGAY